MPQPAPLQPPHAHAACTTCSQYEPPRPGLSGSGPYNPLWPRSSPIPWPRGPYNARIVSRALSYTVLIQRGLAFPPRYGAPVFPLLCLAGGTRPGEEVRDGSHSDNRGGCDRGGVAPTAVTLRSQTGALRGSGFILSILSIGRARHPCCARPIQCSYYWPRLLTILILTSVAIALPDSKTIGVRRSLKKCPPGRCTDPGCDVE